MSLSVQYALLFGFILNTCIDSVHRSLHLTASKNFTYQFQKYYTLQL